MLQSSIVIYLILLTKAFETSPVWNYQDKGVSKWNVISPRFCTGRMQSPIKLSVEESEKNPLLGQYVFSEPVFNPNNTYGVKNDGHKVKITFDNYELNISTSSVHETCYRPVEIHFHWGSDNTKGSEHWLDNKMCPMEGHIVTWDCKYYNTFAEAANAIDGLAVFGIFYQVDPKMSLSSFDHPLRGFTSVFDKVQRCDNCSTDDSAYVSTYMSGFPIKQLLPSNTKNVYVYTGSLTTPNCRENVMWNVFTTPVKIPQAIMDSFRNLEFPMLNNVTSKMVNNYRGPLPLNPTYPLGGKRMLSRSFGKENDDNNPVTTAAHQCTSSAILMVVVYTCFVISNVMLN